MLKMTGIELELIDDDTIFTLTQYLPYGGFKWMTEKEISDFDLNLVRENDVNGYILEVDLEYPSELHNLHNDYPLAPETLKVNSNMLSGYCSDIADKYGIKIGEVKKLIPYLGNKKNYVVRYRSPQLYVLLGMEVKKIHRILKLDSLIG